MLNRSHLLTGFLVLFALSIYLPFLLGGGLIVDDWGDVMEGVSATSFRDAYLGWFPLFSNRPLAPLPIVLTVRAFGLWQYGYVAVNVGIYLAMLGLTGRILYRRVGLVAAVLFFMLASCPAIASVVVFSPINQLTATVSLFFWSLSLTFLDLYLVRPKWYRYALGYICLLYAFLTYEVILPLTVITLFLPLAVLRQYPGMTLLGRIGRYFLTFVLPVVLVLIVVFAWQKLIAPHFMTVYSRFNFSDLHHARYAAVTWLQAIKVKTPHLLMASLNHKPSFLFVFSVTLLGIIMLISLAMRPQRNERKQTGLFLVIAALSFFACSSLYFFNGSEAQVGGYESRGMSSSWIAGVMFFACIVQFLESWQPRRFLQYLSVIAALLFAICGIVLHSFCLQRDNYIESWKEQNQILDDVIAQSHAKGVEARQVIIGDVPYYLQSNYNNEIVFSQPWDFGDALILKSDHFIKAGAVVNKDMDRHHYIEVADDEITLNGYWKEKIGILWYYRFDPIMRVGVLEKIHDADQLRYNVSHLLN